MKKPGRFPIKYKFLLVMVTVFTGGFLLFFLSAQRNFIEDKKRFVMELNLSNLDAATSRASLELSRRLSELQLIVPLVYQRSEGTNSNFEWPVGVEKLKTELVDISFLHRKSDGSVESSKFFSNLNTLHLRNFPPSSVEALASQNPRLVAQFTEGEKLRFWNRSVSGDSQLPILTFLMNAKSQDKEGQMIVVADVIQDFLIESLRGSDVASVFLLSPLNQLISHSSFEETIAGANRKYDHPITSILDGKRIPRESLEVSLKGEKYFCSVAAASLGDLTIVSQISETQSMYALKKLTREWIGIALLILYSALVASLFFSRRLTRNIGRLAIAAGEVGKGNFDVEVGVKSNDEIQSVADSFQTMVTQVKTLLKESVDKTRMEHELKTASTLQSALLEPIDIIRPDFELVSFFRPATECGGDFWHVVQDEESVIFALGDATGHGASAAIVTSLVKSVFSTLKVTNVNRKISIYEYMEALNRSLFESVHGKLLMSLNLCQIDLKSGEVILLNGGHESPLAISKSESGKKNQTEILFAKGERLGFDPKSKFEPVRHQLFNGEVLLFYTDGLIETVGKAGTSWGGRGLKKVFAKCRDQDVRTGRDLISNAFQEHLGENSFEDDVTFILFRWMNG